MSCMVSKNAKPSPHLARAIDSFILDEKNEDCMESRHEIIMRQLIDIPESSDVFNKTANQSPTFKMSKKANFSFHPPLSPLNTLPGTN